MGENYERNYFQREKEERIFLYFYFFSKTMKRSTRTIYLIIYRDNFWEEIEASVTNLTQNIEKRSRKGKGNE